MPATTPAPGRPGRSTRRGVLQRLGALGTYRWTTPGPAGSRRRTAAPPSRRRSPSRPMARSRSRLPRSRRQPPPRRDLGQHSVRGDRGRRGLRRSTLPGITVRASRRGWTNPNDVVDTTTSHAGLCTPSTSPSAYTTWSTSTTTASVQAYTSAWWPRSAWRGRLSPAVGDTAGSPVLPDRLAPSHADTPHRARLGRRCQRRRRRRTDRHRRAAEARRSRWRHHRRRRRARRPRSLPADARAGSYLVEVDGGGHWLDTTYVGEDSSSALVSVQLNGNVLVNGVEVVGGELRENPGRREDAVHGERHGRRRVHRSGRDHGHGLRRGGPDHLPGDDDSGAGGAWSLTGAHGLTVGRYLVDFTGTVDDTTYDRTYFGGATPRRSSCPKAASSPWVAPRSTTTFPGRRDDGVAGRRRTRCPGRPRRRQRRPDRGATVTVCRRATPPAPTRRPSPPVPATGPASTS